MNSSDNKTCFTQLFQDLIILLGEENIKRLQFEMRPKSFGLRPRASQSINEQQLHQKVIR